MLNEVAANRTAQQGAAHQAEGGRSGGDGGTGLQTGLLQDGAPGSGGAVAAHHGDGAAGHAHQGVYAHQLTDQDAQTVLEDHQNAGEDQKQNDLGAALAQQLPAGGVTDAGVEQQAEEVVEGAVQRELAQTGHVQYGNEQRKEYAADHGGGDTELTQDVDVFFDEVAHHQHNDGQSNRVIHVQTDFQHDEVSPPIL